MCEGWEGVSLTCGKDEGEGTLDQSGDSESDQK